MKQRTLPDFFRYCGGRCLFLQGDKTGIVLPKVTAFLEWWTREQSVENQLELLAVSRTFVERNKCKLFDNDFPYNQ